MIYDCFTFFNEFDTLEIRLEELYPVVDKFVICESTKTHSGKDKSLRYLENINRYKKYADKIKYVVYNTFPKQYDSWVLEANQRRHLITGIDLTSLKDSDIIMVSDLDEIPRRSFVQNLKVDYLKNPEKYNQPITLGSQLYYNKLTYKVVEPEEFNNWRGTSIITGNILKNNKDLHWYRHFKDSFTNMKNTGWHFSYLGDETQIIEKIESFAHVEGDTPERKATVRKNIGKCVDLFERPEFKMQKVDIDESYPELVKSNPERFAHII
jgi:beta-1,4-mannosyl-glycoprotein beta-1,4-N-acetylglucosaminyltransferase